MVVLTRYVLEQGGAVWTVRDSATGKHITVEKGSEAEMKLLFRLWDDTSLSLTKAIEKNQQVLGRLFA